MSKKIKPEDNKANQKNANPGPDGQNKQRSQAEGNRGKQLNPNQGKKK